MGWYCNACFSHWMWFEKSLSEQSALLTLFLFFTLKKVFFLFMWMCGSTGVQAPTEAGWRHPVPWSWSCLTGCWESHWDPSGKQQCSNYQAIPSALCFPFPVPSACPGTFNREVRMLPTFLLFLLHRDVFFSIFLERGSPGYGVFRLESSFPALEKLLCLLLIAVGSRKPAVMLTGVLLWAIY